MPRLVAPILRLKDVSCFRTFGSFDNLSLPLTLLLTMLESSNQPLSKGSVSAGKQYGNIVDLAFSTI